MTSETSLQQVQQAIALLQHDRPAEAEPLLLHDRVRLGPAVLFGIAAMAACDVAACTIGSTLDPIC